MEQLSPFLRIIFAFVLAMGITAFIIPSLVALARKKSLFAISEGRNVHTGAVPNLGGIALFSAIMLSSWIFWDVKEIGSFQFKVVSILIIFLLGLLDDMLKISALRKFGGEILAIFVLVFLGGVRITHFHGYFYLGEINYLTSILITIFVFLLIINSFNLIDGIDGLAAGIGMVCCATYGIWFYRAGFVEHSVMAAATLGALLVFFYYNVFSKKFKIFMGDTGSLVTGVVVAIFTIQFNQQTINEAKYYYVYAAPAVSMGILVIPFFDTLRVFTLRILAGKSPFDADRRHLHHLLIDLGLSHLQATLILVSVNVGMILLVFYLQSLRIHTTLFVGILLAIMLGLTTITTSLKKKQLIH